jgi:pilus assembly protein CpaC
MSASPCQRHGRSGFAAPHPLIGTAFVFWVCLLGRAAAQPQPLPLPPPQPLLQPQPPACPIGGLPTCLPTLPDQPHRPPIGPEALTSFIDSLSVKDGVFEVVVGQGRILTTKEDIATRKGAAMIAVGSPYIIDFVMVSPRQLRIIGLRLGTTDLSITTSDNRTYSVEVRVVADLDVLRGQLKCIFPDASIRLGQIRDHIVVEGEARDNFQIARILQTIQAYLLSIRSIEVQTSTGNLSAQPPPPAAKQAQPPPGQGGEAAPPAKKEGEAAVHAPELKPVSFEEMEQVAQLPLPGMGGVPGTGPSAGGALSSFTPLLPYSPGFASLAAAQVTVPMPQIINLLRVPGTQQVLLKVRVAELNRSALRQIGADWTILNPKNLNMVSTAIGGATVVGNGTVAGGSASGDINGPSNTFFTIFPPGHFEMFFSALRQNSLAKILAEPNLIAMNGHQASFLAGGQFPVPVPQAVTGGAGTTVTVQFQEFGVRLAFVPYILDNEIIRLAVDPEVSTVDTTLSTTLVPGGSPVPGLDTRKAHTVVEMQQGQTLAIAGLMQLTLNAQTTRIPFFGDLPILGPFFQNSTSQRTEKELLVLVTPYLISPMKAGQVPPTPGDEVNEPNDLEFYLLHRIQGRTGRDWRSTTDYTGRILSHCLKMEMDHVQGPHGFCE